MEKIPKLLAIFIAFIIIGSGIVIKPVEGEEKNIKKITITFIYFK